MARPKKLVLVVEGDPNILSITMLAITCHGFAVVGVYTVNEARALLDDGCCPYAILLNSPTRDSPYEIQGITCLARRRDCNMAEVIMYLRIMCQRKRGPKPGSTRVQRSAIA